MKVYELPAATLNVMPGDCTSVIVNVVAGVAEFSVIVTVVAPDLAVMTAGVVVTLKVVVCPRTVSGVKKMSAKNRASFLKWRFLLYTSAKRW